MARKTKEEALETRENILMAALDLFSEKGYSRTTLSDISKSIGMTRGAVYWHFENKEALLTALISHISDLKKDSVQSRMPEIETLEDIRSAYVAYAQQLFETPVFHQFEYFVSFQMEWSTELLAETDRKLNEARQKPMEEFRFLFNLPEVSKRIRPDVDLDLLTLTLASFWVGACKLYMGNFYGIEFNSESDSAGEKLIETIGRGFDLIMNSVLK